MTVSADSANAPRPRRTVAIVGAGFSGAVTAIQLLRHAGPGWRVVLVNESGRMARGLAYGTHSKDHVLNVPAGNMSALADDPDDFLRFCRWSNPEVQAHSFVPRRLYGAYLESLLTAAEMTARSDIVLERVVGRVTGLVHGEPKSLLHLHDGRVIAADHVVLAFGHFPPRDPLTAGEVAEAGPRYVQDPWRPGALAAIGADDDVLLVGAGLTAVDVALALGATARTGRLISISRRGLAPQSHRRSGVVQGAVDGAALVAAMGGSLRGQVRVVRAEVRQRVARGEDWRDVIGALRAHTPALWQGLSMADRARFMRHLRPHWEVLRHRCAPQAHDAFAALAASGGVELAAARLRRVQAVEGGLEVTLQPRGQALPQVRRVQAIVNCTGPTSDLRRSSSPLIQGLLDEGRLVADPLGLGLEVDEQHRVLDRDGHAQDWLRYIGPLLKARLWEATAVPELRLHARQLAAHLLGG